MSVHNLTYRNVLQDIENCIDRMDECRLWLKNNPNCGSDKYMRSTEAKVLYDLEKLSKKFVKSAALAAELNKQMIEGRKSVYGNE